MSCGCKGGAANPEIFEAIEELPTKTFITPDETIECYMQRIGPQEAAPAEPQPVDKIATNNISADCKMQVNTPFKMTPESQLPVEWELTLTDENGNQITPDSLGLTFDTSSGLLKGTVKDEFEKKSISAKMIAKKDGNSVDERSYKFVPKKCDPTDLKFIHPDPKGTLTSKFGMRTHPVTGVQKMHKGIDISTGGKADILASADGEVAYVGSRSGYGNVVEIDHKDPSGKLLAKTRYAHLASQYVSNGQQVAAGTPIGKEGNTGIGTGAHLHFEILMGGSTPVDPLLYINGSIKVDANDANEDPGNPSGNSTTVENKDKGLTKEEIVAKSTCKPFDGNAQDPTYKNNPGGKSPDVQSFAHKSQCRPEGPEGKPSKDEVIAKVNAQMDKHPELTEEDRKYILGLVKVESSYDPYAANSSSSSLGLFQFLDGTAKEYYGKAGIEPTCENRCNPTLATEAAIYKFHDDEKRYTEFKSKGTVLGKNPPDSAATKYNSMSKTEFLYSGYHDGWGNIQKGNDKQGYAVCKTHFPA
jgi:hypothetical protein